MLLPQRGELWWADLEGVGQRPVVVLSRDAAIQGRRRTMVAACSTVVRGLPSEVALDPHEEPVDRPCVIQLDAVVDVPARVLVRRLGRLSDVRMREVCDALAVATGCDRGI
ncbi:MAG: type II toxin-antitoxin system PemK/MazF family toxin [Actinomycetia bacterium]|nr:type II toxin-antitoxin system PemK/MazF family toxin [Actinomycetes bacterium]